MKRPAKVCGDGDKSPDSLQPDNRGESVEEVRSVFLFKAACHQSCFVARRISVVASFDFEHPS